MRPKKSNNFFNTGLLLITFYILLVSTPMAAPSRYIEPTTNTEFTLVAGGDFTMGDVRGVGYDIERPARIVTVDTFYMSKFEITFNQYDIFCEATKRNKPSDNGWGRGNQPVINVSWDDAQAFAAWLSKKSGRNIRLPSESEWEYAAQAGRKTEFWWGDNSGKNNANCSDCGSKWDGQQPAPVGSFSANPYGLYDMHGNVYEWCQDTRHDTYDGAPAGANAWTGGPTPNQRIVRSGSYLMPSIESRARARSWNLSQRSSREQGIRLVLTP